MRNCLLAGILIVVGSTASVAQSDLLPSTQLMRAQAQSLYSVLNRMVKGESPYDQAKVDAALAALADNVKKISAAFPESSKGKMSANTRYSASAKVWENKADFEAKIASMVKAIDENRGKATSLDGLKAAYPAINGACNGCHETYRVRKS